MNKEDLQIKIIKGRIAGDSYIKIAVGTGKHPDQIKYIAEKLGVNGAFVRELRFQRLQAREEELKTGRFL